MRIIEGEQVLMRIFIGQADRMGGGLVTMEEVRVLRYENDR